MAYIYKITNDINDKIQIGKTESSIEKRFKEHCKDSKKERNEKRPLYDAMNKYGIEHFHAELVEETDNPEEREKYWIEYYGSFKYGYNATKGGDGKSYIDYDLVVAVYKETQNQKETAKKLNIDRCTVKKILNIKHVQTIKNVSQILRQKVVHQYDLKGNYITSYASLTEAVKAIGKYTPTSKKGAISHISDVCKGKRKSAYGYKWKFD